MEGLLGHTVLNGQKDICKFPNNTPPSIENRGGDTSNALHTKIMFTKF